MIQSKDTERRKKTLHANKVNCGIAHLFRLQSPNTNHAHSKYILVHLNQTESEINRIDT